MVSEFECTIHRSNNLDSNEKFGDNSPIYIKGQDIGKIVPEIVSYSTADKTVDYFDATKVTFEREKKVRYIFDESEIEFLNNKFNYGLKSYLVLPQKLSKTIYLDKDGELKHYEGAFPYEDMYKLNESEEFQEDKVEFENSFGYMTKHLLTTLTDSEKRTKYFSMIKADKKLNKKIIAGVVAVAVVIVIALACVTVPKINEYNLHKYDGIWLLDNNVKKGYIEIEGKDVEFYIIGGNPHESLFKYGKKDNNIKITGFISYEEIKKILSESMCMVVPLINGSGIKIKVLEGFSAGIPVLSNNVGMRGIPARNKVDYLHCEKAEDFIKSIEFLINNPREIEKIGKNGYCFLHEKFNKRKSAELFIDIIEKVGYNE